MCRPIRRARSPPALKPTRGRRTDKDGAQHGGGDAAGRSPQAAHLRLGGRALLGRGHGCAGRCGLLLRRRARPVRRPRLLLALLQLRLQRQHMALLPGAAQRQRRGSVWGLFAPLLGAALSSPPRRGLPPNSATAARAAPAHALPPAAPSSLQAQPTSCAACAALRAAASAASRPAAPAAPSCARSSAAAWRSPSASASVAASCAAYCFSWER